VTVYDNASNDGPPESADALTSACWGPCLQDAGSKKGKRVNVQAPPPRPQVPAGLESSLQNFDDLEAAKK